MSDSPKPTSTDQKQASMDVAAALIELARATVANDDTVGLFALLAHRTVQVLNIEAAGVLLVNPTGTLTAIGSSNHSAHLLDLFQIQTDQGPCLECSMTGEQVVDVDLSDDGPWPLFARAAHDWGYTAAYALPLASRGITLGALNLFTTTPLSARELTLGQALADMATLGIIRADPNNDTDVITRALLLAMESRITVEQAKGMLAVRFNEDADAAFNRIQGAADATGMPLALLAASVVQRTTDPAVDQALVGFQGDSTTTPRQKA